jgi:hypothetical protein
VIVEEAIATSYDCGANELRYGAELAEVVLQSTYAMTVMTTVSVFLPSAKNHVGSESLVQTQGCTVVCNAGVNALGSGTTQSARGSGRGFTEDTAH